MLCSTFSTDSIWKLMYNYLLIYEYARKPAMESISKRRGRERARRLYNPNFSFQTFPRPKSKCRSPTRPTVVVVIIEESAIQFCLTPARLLPLPSALPVGQSRAEQSGAERESMMQNFLKPFPGKLNVRCSIAERGVEAEGEGTRWRARSCLCTFFTIRFLKRPKENAGGGMFANATVKRLQSWIGILCILITNNMPATSPLN